MGKRILENPAWVAVGLTVAVTVIGWASAFAVTKNRVESLKEQYTIHCVDQKQRELRTEDKLEKILQSLSRVEAKLEDRRR